MSIVPVPLTGGESVYCINQAQLAEAFRLAEHDPQSAPKIQAEIARLEKEMTRNERASLAFVLIDKLLKTVTK